MRHGLRLMLGGAQVRIGGSRTGRSRHRGSAVR
jgi:hypothetical protein